MDIHNISIVDSPDDEKGHTFSFESERDAKAFAAWLKAQPSPPWGMHIWKA